MLVVLSVLSFIAAIVFGALAWHARREEQRRSDARVAALAMAIDGDMAAQPPAAHPMFTPERHVAARGNPILKAAVGIAMTVLVVIAVAMAAHDKPSTGTTAEHAGQRATAGADAGTRLELLAMRDSRNRDALTVSGLVRNARSSGEIDHVSAVVLAFGRDGTFIASSRAPLDMSRLRPGEESPFVVTVPGAAGVERYRVTFRTDHGVIRHLDLRNRV